MSDSLDTVISAQLAPGEQLIWSDKPKGGFRLSLQDLAFVPLSFILCVIVFNWERNAFITRYPLATQLFGVLFMLIGLHLLVGRFLVEALRRSTTFYGMTEDRILIVTNLIFKNVNSISLQTLGEISLSERNDGSGSILLGRLVYSSAGSDAACYIPPTLDSIPEARRVYELILAQQKRLLSEVSL